MCPLFCPLDEFDFRWAKRSEAIKSISNFIVYISDVRLLAIPTWGKKKCDLPVCLNLSLIPETFVIFLFPLVISSCMFYMKVLGMCEKWTS